MCKFLPFHGLFINFTNKRETNFPLKSRKWMMCGKSHRADRCLICAKLHLCLKLSCNRSLHDSTWTINISKHFKASEVSECLYAYTSSYNMNRQCCNTYIRDARGGLFLLCSLGRAADNNGWQEVNILILSPNFFNGGSAQNTWLV